MVSTNVFMRTRCSHKLILLEDGSGEHSGSGGTITSSVIGSAGYLTHQLSTHVHEPVLELNVLRDCDTILGDLRRTKALV